MKVDPLRGLGGAEGIVDEVLGVEGLLDLFVGGGVGGWVAGGRGCCCSCGRLKL